MFEGENKEFFASEEADQKDRDVFKAETLSLLDKFDIRLDPDLKDQHLLVSPEDISKLVGSAELTSDDVVLEIGPGLGQITKEIVQKAGKVYAIEIDERFRPILQDLEKKYSNLEIIFGSALDKPWPRVNKLVSSPPYSILEPLLEHLAMKKKIELISLVIGEKYYQRCIDLSHPAKTSLITQAFFDIKLISKLDKGSFYPPSRESSVIINLLRKDKKKADMGLRVLVSRMINTPNESVISVLRDILSENINLKKLKSMDFRDIPRISSLKVPENILKKRLQDLDNEDIAVISTVIKQLRNK